MVADITAVKTNWSLGQLSKIDLSRSPNTDALMTQETAREQKIDTMNQLGEFGCCHQTYVEQAVVRHRTRSLAITSGRTDAKGHCSLVDYFARGHELQIIGQFTE